MRNLVGAATLALGMVLAPGAAASASATVSNSSATSTDVLLSTDGIEFTSDLDGGLFDGVGALIPGESLTSGLWIKNPTDAPAVVRVSARNMRVTSLDFADDVTMSAWDSVTDDTRTGSLAAMDQCDILVPSQWIAAGETVSMVITFAMDDRTGNGGQDQRVAMDLMVSMRDDEAGAFPDSACDDDGLLIPSAPAPSAPAPSDGTTPDGATPDAPGSASAASDTSLAMTGAGFPVPLLVASGLLLGAGVFLLTVRHRKGNPS